MHGLRRRSGRIPQYRHCRGAKPRPFLERSRHEKIEAPIKTHCLRVIAALVGVSSHAIQGFGRFRGDDKPVRIVDIAMNDVPHVKLDVLCVAALQDRMRDVITQGAHTALRAEAGFSRGARLWPQGVSWRTWCCVP